MKYSQHVIDETIRLFPANKRLEDMARMGDFYLADQIEWESSGYPYRKINEIIHNNGDNALQEVARFVRHEYDICETYRMCSTEMDRIMREGGTVRFSPEFVDKVKEVFISEDPSFIQMAESNDGFIYRCIDERRWQMPFKSIFADLESEDPTKTITEKCEHAKDVSELLSEVKQERYDAMQSGAPSSED